ncbi:glycoside hydrolase family 43 protein [Dothidotthia symphoricarpi CBS 119687]|uniref:Glycoside hydrolase family 43 protein n=1 Tax=Dothidotthia symphoricarpi CBS 119687 TaxID=1392245 RepID=A0A6A6A9S3_9PLEO|nr:glycoside hydrolase family 43 protein [Dothidotthia symphoricarpi CBS 119687]KAF2128692.1 glycoside hydrolase family 43 protein [Dothidotthia symphoricarpi CBS 119687]
MRFLQNLGACVLALSSLVSAATFTNPLRTTDGSDPQIVVSGGYYYLMTTTWTNLKITRATTIEGLKTGETKTVWTDTNSNRCCNMWAPELHYLDGAWYIYYTAGSSANLDLQRVHVVKGGATPFDSYSYLAQMTSAWGIDGSIVRFNTWGNFLTWSCMAGDLQSICIASLSSPGKIGTTKVLSTPAAAWETHGSPVMEGPVALYHGGKTFIAYSASYCWTPDYSLGLLTWNGSGDPSLSASWKKTGPFLTSANGNYGAGHNAFFNSPDGTEIWNVYHATANSAGACDGSRYTMVQKVNWNSDGSPNFGSPVKVGTKLTGPSGE